MKEEIMNKTWEIIIVVIIIVAIGIMAAVTFYPPARAAMDSMTSSFAKTVSNIGSLFK